MAKLSLREKLVVFLKYLISKHFYPYVSLW